LFISPPSLSCKALFGPPSPPTYKSRLAAMIGLFQFRSPPNTPLPFPCSPLLTTTFSFYLWLMMLLPPLCSVKMPVSPVHFILNLWLVTFISRADQSRSFPSFRSPPPTPNSVLMFFYGSVRLVCAPSFYWSFTLFFLRLLPALPQENPPFAEFPPFLQRMVARHPPPNVFFFWLVLSLVYVFFLSFLQYTLQMGNPFPTLFSPAPRLRSF